MRVISTPARKILNIKLNIGSPAFPFHKEYRHVYKEITFNNLFYNTRHGECNVTAGQPQQILKNNKWRKLI